MGRSVLWAADSRRRMAAAIVNSEQLGFPDKDEGDDNFWVDGGDKLQASLFPEVLLTVDSWLLA